MKREPSIYVINISTFSFSNSRISQGKRKKFVKKYNLRYTRKLFTIARPDAKASMGLNRHSQTFSWKASMLALELNFFFFFTENSREPACKTLDWGMDEIRYTELFQHFKRGSRAVRLVPLKNPFKRVKLEIFTWFHSDDWFSSFFACFHYNRDTVERKWMRLTAYEGGKKTNTHLHFMHDASVQGPFRQTTQSPITFQLLWSTGSTDHSSKQV